MGYRNYQEEDTSLWSLSQPWHRRQCSALQVLSGKGRYIIQCYTNRQWLYLCCGSIPFEWDVVSHILYRVNLRREYKRQSYGENCEKG